LLLENLPSCVVFCILSTRAASMSPHVFVVSLASLFVVCECTVHLQSCGSDGTCDDPPARSSSLLQIKSSTAKQLSDHNPVYELAMFSKYVRPAEDDEWTQELLDELLASNISAAQYIAKAAREDAPNRSKPCPFARVSQNGWGDGKFCEPHYKLLTTGWNRSSGIDEKVTISACYLLSQVIWHPDDATHMWYWGAGSGSKRSCRVCGIRGERRRYFRNSKAGNNLYSCSKAR